MGTTTAGIHWTTMGPIVSKERPPREPARFDPKEGSFTIVRRWYIEANYELVMAMLSANSYYGADPETLFAPDPIPLTFMLPHDPTFNLPITMRRVNLEVFWYGENSKCEIEATYLGHMIAFCNGSYEWNGVLRHPWEPGTKSERRTFSLDTDASGNYVSVGGKSQGVNVSVPDQHRLVIQNIGADEMAEKEALIDYLIGKTNTEGWNAPWMDAGVGAVEGSYLYLAPEIVEHTDFTYTLTHRFHHEPAYAHKHYWFFAKAVKKSDLPLQLPQKVSLGTQQESTLYQTADMSGLFDPCFVATTTA